MKNKRDNRKSQGESTKDQKNRTKQRTKEPWTNSCSHASECHWGCTHGMNRYPPSWTSEWPTPVWSLHFQDRNLYFDHVMFGWEVSKILYYCASRLEKARETARTWHFSTSVTSARSANDTMRVSRLIPAKSEDHKMHCGMTDWLLSSSQGAGRKPSKGRKILSIGFFGLEQSNRLCVKILYKIRRTTCQYV